MVISCTAYLSLNKTIEEKQELIKFLDNFGEDYLKTLSSSVYWNDPSHNFPKNDWRERYWGGMDNYNRLLKVKSMTDPNNYFTCYHCVNYTEEQNGVEPALCPVSTCSCSNSNGRCALVANIINSGFRISINGMFKYFIFLALIFLM